ncbi:MAG: Zn-dependent hydrolase [Pseudomonadota bacterium]
MANDSAPQLSTRPSNSFITHDLRDLARDLFEQFREMSFDGIGISRETYGAGETDAMKVVEKLAQQSGLETQWDAAQNLIVRLSGSEPGMTVVATGSHLDSVPQGGNYDGAAGVIGGLLALLAAQARGGPKRPMELLVLRGEESAWFGGPCYFGSRAMFGQLSDADLASKHRDNGLTLAEQMTACGVDIGRIKAQDLLRNPEEFHSWLEIHIEQGPVLIARDKPVGLVTGIRGNVRHRRVICRGEAAHSGAVPRWLRHDAVLAMAELLMRIDEHWRVLLEWGEDLVVTSGVVETNPTEHAVSRVPGEVTFALEYRSQDTKTLESFSNLVRSECDQIASKRGVTFELGDPVETEPAKMSEKVVDVLTASADVAQIDYEILPSGAGHDSAVFANSGVPSAMIFVRNDKGSHNPQEAMEMADFYESSEVLARALWQMANMEDEVRS